MTTQYIQVKLELGHKASVRAKPTAEGFTHDWTVFVRGPEGSNIQHFVERVVFHLHESFPKPKRVVKEPPYQVSESGYAGFLLPIEVHFKNKEEPKKVIYQYDLFLQLLGACNHARLEKLTFQNPTDEFWKKLIKAGGIGILGSEGGPNPLQKPSPRPSTPTSHSSSHSKTTKHVSEAIKAPKSSCSTSSSVSASCAVSTNPPLAPVKEAKPAPLLHPPQQSFLDLFGQPIKSNKASPDPQKSKDAYVKGCSSKSSKASNSSLSSNEQSSSNSGSTKEPKSSLSKETKDTKESKSHSKERNVLKRSLSPPLSPISDAGQAKKSKGLSSSSAASKVSKDVKDKRKSDKKVISKDKEKKEKKDKHKHNGDPGTGSKPSAERKNVGEKVRKETDVGSKVSKKSKLPLSASPSLSSSSVSSDVKTIKPCKVSPPSPDAFGEVEGEGEGDGDASPSSSISFSSLHPSKGSGPLGTLMAELDEQDDDEILSPLSSDSSCPPRSVREEDEEEEDPVPLPPPPLVPPPVVKSCPSPLVTKQPPPPANRQAVANVAGPEIAVDRPKAKAEKVAVKEEKNHGKDKKPKKSHSGKSEKRLPEPVAGKKANKVQAKEPVRSGPETLPPSGISDDYITELKELQRQIMSLRDRKHLQQIVNVIEETGQYQVTSTTFDFDLCTLDRVTVKKLQSCLAAQTVV